MIYIERMKRGELILYINKTLKFIFKLLIATVAFIYIITISTMVLYVSTYKIINTIDPSIYTRYATENKHDKDLFTEGIQTTRDIFIDLTNTMPELKTRNSQEFASIIIENRSEVEKIIRDNPDYSKYLTKNNSSVSEMFEFYSNIAGLNDRIFTSCFFISSVFYALIATRFFNLRKTIYSIGALLYFSSILSTFSYGLSDYLLINFFNILSKIISFTLSSKSFSYTDIEIIRTLFYQNYKEGILTFLMIDTIIEMRSLESNKRLFYFIDHIINTLEKSQNINTIYKLKFKYYKDEEIINYNSLKILLKTRAKLSKIKILKAIKELFESEDQIEKNKTKQTIRNLINSLKNEANTSLAHLQTLKEIRLLLISIE